MTAACALDLDLELEDAATTQLVVLGIDVGVLHLALAVTLTNANFSSFRVSHVELIDTRILQHDRVAQEKCTLQHTGMACDRVAHLLQEREALFRSAHVVVVERQPPGGLRDVEQVLATLLRHKVCVMAPQTMHAHIGSSGMPYAERKAWAVEVASSLVPELVVRFPKADDVADAICLAKTFVDKAGIKHAASVGKEKAKEAAHSQGLDFRKYMYTGKFAVPSSFVSSSSSSETSEKDTTAPPGLTKSKYFP
jgi:hypothetical protein